MSRKEATAKSSAAAAAVAAKFSAADPPPAALSAAEVELADHHEKLMSQDYNRTKAGLGAGGGDKDDATAAKGVAAMYNSLADRHRTLDAGSDILHLRNLNNFVKSVLFNKYLPKGDRQRGCAVLDLACGKGGDMLKFKAANIAVYVGIDIAANSVRDAAVRYNGANGRAAMPFAATLMAGDYCDPTFPAKLPAHIRFGFASCQFSMHYAFRSEAKARAFLANTTCRLQPGGVLVASCPDANVLVKRLRAASGTSFGNGIYQVKFAAAHASKAFAAAASPFGLAYTFALKEAVDECEEYLVHLPTLTRLASEYGLELVEASNFTDFFAAEWRRNGPLLDRMKVLPADGFVSEEEWEVAHCYMVLALRKRDDGGNVALTPPPPEANPGHRKLDADRDIIYLNPDEAPAPPPPSAAARKRPREEAAGAAHGEEGEARSQVDYQEQDALFD